MSLFNSVLLAPNDPILGVVETFNQDERKNKVNLSIGIYTDEAGKIPVLKSIQLAQDHFVHHPVPKSYLPIDGLPSYTEAVQKLLFGKNSSLLEEKRVVTLQSLGGTGALNLGAFFLKTITPQSTAYVSNPTWDNHKSIFKAAGFEVKEYPYFDPKTGGVDFDQMLSFFNQLNPQSIVILHVCCHNPTGADLTIEQWKTLALTIKDRQLIPFLDMAYQGFSNSVEADAKPIKIMTDLGITCFIGSSFSKSLSLYSERVGALSVITHNKDEQERVKSQLKQVVRGNYSSPPSYGARLAGFVLQSDELTKMWIDELDQMRNRIKKMRTQLVEELNARQSKIDFSFINQQNGMFSYSGLSAQQVEKMKAEHAVYTVNTGRICVAALNQSNIEQAIQAMIAVL